MIDLSLQYLSMVLCGSKFDIGRVVGCYAKSKLRLNNLVILFQVKCKSPGVICWFARSHYSVAVLRVIFLKTCHGSCKWTFSLSPILWPYYYTLSFMIFSSLGMLSRICLKIPWKEALISVCVNQVILTILKRHSTVVNLSCCTQLLCTITNYFICCFNVSMSLRLSHFYLYFWVTLTYFCTTNVILYFLCISNVIGKTMLSSIFNHV